MCSNVRYDNQIKNWNVYTSQSKSAHFNDFNNKLMLERDKENVSDTEQSNESVYAMEDTLRTDRNEVKGEKLKESERTADRFQSNVSLSLFVGLVILKFLFWFVVDSLLRHVWIQFAYDRVV